jgi:riboflavin kinase / FMN adenylyltransferase
VIDWSGDLYDEPAKVRFVKRLRTEMKFASIESLVEQMQNDVAEARHILGVN